MDRTDALARDFLDALESCGGLRDHREDDGSGFCPLCGEIRELSHTPECEYGKLLRYVRTGDYD